MSDNLLQKWTYTTGNLDWGKQRTLHDTLTMVSEGKVKVVFGQDDFSGSPCLINAVGCMVKSENQSPSENEPALVGLFDRICAEIFVPAGIIEQHPFLSGLAADILLKNFAPLKPVPEASSIPITAKYKEPKDREMQADFEKMLDTPAPDAGSEVKYLTVEETDEVLRKSE